MDILTREQVHELFDEAMICKNCHAKIGGCKCDNFDPIPVIYMHFLPNRKGLVLRLWRENNDAHVSLKHTYVYHSPTGFEWGYLGSGPADLALNILAHFVPTQEAWRLHHRYMNEVIARIPMKGTTIYSDEVEAWIQNVWEDEVQSNWGV